MKNGSFFEGKKKKWLPETKRLPSKVVLQRRRTSRDENHARLKIEYVTGLEPEGSKNGGIP